MNHTCSFLVFSLEGEVFSTNLPFQHSRLLTQANGSQLTLFRPVDRDVFVLDLSRQLGTPSHWLPVDSCKKEDKEAP